MGIESISLKISSQLHRIIFPKLHAAVFTHQNEIKSLRRNIKSFTK